ncbi:hypothetical protein RB195_010466 [Necator americanus]|uniref:Uncharacterized protein n=1 Tax=Necator americanus TaxID=51031 RepID=A0ABR1CY33_NECAM
MNPDDTVAQQQQTALTLQKEAPKDKTEIDRRDSMVRAVHLHRSSSSSHSSAGTRVLDALSKQQLRIWIALVVEFLVKIYDI